MTSFLSTRMWKCSSHWWISFVFFQLIRRNWSFHQNTGNWSSNQNSQEVFSIPGFPPRLASVDYWRASVKFFLFGIFSSTRCRERPRLLLGLQLRISQVVEFPLDKGYSYGPAYLNRSRPLLSRCTSFPLNFTKWWVLGWEKFLHTF